MSRSLPHDWAGFHWESSSAKLPAILHRRENPTPVRAPKLVVLNEPLARELALDPSALASDDGAALLAGNLSIDGLEPIAQAYAGHQFGHFTILGDGRAIALGQHRTPTGQLVDVQWKGPGPTAFSRGGDGRLALGPALREFLISEAMAALGIPTTRSLAVVATGEGVFREEILPGAVLMRIAASHVRVGTFQFALVSQDPAALKALVEFCIARHYPELGAAGPSLSPERVSRFLEGVIDRQAELVAKWLSVGFIHGVMNTDNMTISGETIDFGPCAFLDQYDPNTVFSSIDRGGRYAFGQQPGIAGWNLARLGDTLILLLGPTPEEGQAVATAVMETFAQKFGTQMVKVFNAKLGLAETRDDDAGLLQDLLAIAAREHLDFHRMWLELTDAGPDSDALPLALVDWGTRWAQRLHAEGTSTADAVARMRRANPVVIPRNHRVEHALDRARAGDLHPFQQLLAAVRTPFLDTAEAREIGAPPAQPNPNYRTFCGT